MSGETDVAPLMEQVSRVQKQLEQMESRLFGVRHQVRSSSQSSRNGEYDFNRNDLGHWYKGQASEPLMLCSCPKYSVESHVYSHTQHTHNKQKPRSKKLLKESLKSMISATRSNLQCHPASNERAPQRQKFK